MDGRTGLDTREHDEGMFCRAIVLEYLDLAVQLAISRACAVLNSKKEICGG